LIWKHGPREYGSPKTLYNRWTRWSRMGVFATIMTELATMAQATEIVIIEATTRYDKTAESYFGFLDITSIRFWLRHLST
jgi:transposase